MTLNTFWFQRITNALKSRSPIAATVHWGITRYRLMRSDRKFEQEMQIHGVGGLPACRVYDMHVSTLELHPGSITDVEFTRWTTEPAPTCEACRRHRFKVAEVIGLTQFLTGRLR